MGLDGGIVQGHFPAGRPGFIEAASFARARGQAVPLPPSVQLPQSPGRPLEAGVRQRMEQVFGTSFEKVRVVIGDTPSKIGAQAFTSGDRVFVHPTFWAPESPRGTHLLAHELAHVVQQRERRVRRPPGPGLMVVVDGGLEAEADRFGHKAVALGTSRRVPGPTGPKPPVQRRPGLQQVPGGGAVPFAAVPGPRHGAAIQPLTYSRFQGFSRLFNWSYSAQEVRINALEERIDDALRETRRYFSRERSFMGVPLALEDLIYAMRGIRRAKYGNDDLDRIERELNTLLQRFDRLSTGWAKIDRWRPTNPKARLVQGIAKSRYAIYVNTKYVDIRKKSDLKWFVDELFQRFITFGFRYNATTGANPSFLGSDNEAVRMMLNPMNLDRYGSCVTFAFAFANLLKEYGIEAAAEWVVREHQLFLARVPQFIDPGVSSNLEDRGVLRTPYIVFQGHAATRVKGLDDLYDPMAKSKYRSIKPNIECLLQEQDNRTLAFRGTCKTLMADRKRVSSRDFYLEVDSGRTVGGLSYYKLKRKG